MAYEIRNNLKGSHIARASDITTKQCLLIYIFRIQFVRLYFESNIFK